MINTTTKTSFSQPCLPSGIPNCSLRSRSRATVASKQVDVAPERQIDAIDPTIGRIWPVSLSSSASPRVGDHTSTERFFYNSSLPADAKRTARAVRSHWKVENRPHRLLVTVPLREDPPQHGHWFNDSPESAPL